MKVAIRKGKIFELGKYPDKRFEINAPEADLAVANQPDMIPMNIEHIKSPLDGLLGHIKNVVRKGNDLLGEWHMPAPLAELLHGQPVKLSCEWDTAAKMLTGCAIVMNPRIRDAVMFKLFGEIPIPSDTPEALVATFAADAYKTWMGQWHLQQLHDDAAGWGAICTEGDGNMNSADEADAFQQVHDITVAAGAECDSGAVYYSEALPLEEGQKESVMRKMSMKAVKAALTSLFGEAVEIEPEVPFVDPKPPTPETPAAEFKVEETEAYKAIAAELAVIKEAEVAKFKADNEAAIDRLIGKKIKPADKEKYVTWRAADPASFDADFATRPLLAEFGGGSNIPAHFIRPLTGEEALKNAEGGNGESGMEKSMQVANDVHALSGSIYNL